MYLSDNKPAPFAGYGDSDSGRIIQTQMWQESLSEWGMSQVSQTSHQPQSWQKQGKNQEARHQKGTRKKKPDQHPKQWPPGIDPWIPRLLTNNKVPPDIPRSEPCCNVGRSAPDT
jgi:hypothetical protein